MQIGNGRKGPGAEFKIGENIEAKKKGNSLKEGFPARD